MYDSQLNSEHIVIATPIGKLRISEKEGYIVEIAETTQPIFESNNPLLNIASDQIRQFFNGQRTVFTFPIKLETGTEFQKIVWNECRKTPYGKTQSYGELALNIGKKGSARAIGNALKNNPILLAIPCHRITGHKSLGGYRLGLQNKKMLLTLESSQASDLFENNILK